MNHATNKLENKPDLSDYDTAVNSMLMPGIFRNLIFVSHCKRKGKDKGKIHPRTGHECPEVD